MASLTGGKLRYALAELAALPRAAVVVEDRYSQVFKLDRIRPALVADGLAELQIRWPNVPIVFCETRQLAEEWTYRFLAAAHAWAETEHASLAYPDTCVGTDSHTTMVNGLGVLGWGVGGIEAEAAMLGQPVSMLIPQVVGFKLTGELPAGATATDLVLTITEHAAQARRRRQVRRVLRRGRRAPCRSPTGRRSAT